MKLLDVPPDAITHTSVVSASTYYQLMCVSENVPSHSSICGRRSTNKDGVIDTGLSWMEGTRLKKANL